MATPADPLYPTYFEMVRVGVGEFAIVLMVTNSFDEGSYTVHFKYGENSEIQVFTRGVEILNPGTGTIPPVLLADNSTNWRVIARSMKSFATQDYSAVPESIVSIILTEIAKVVNKLPGGNISDLSLDNIVDGVVLREIFALIKSWVNGRFTVDTGTGDVTFYKHDNVTPLTVVHVTETTRTRIS
jgi:hypothetical protein